jgi:quercetin 2,3-dioxygenase
MSAGRGVLHSEFNPSPSERVHLLQIWIEPDRRSITPSYEQIQIDDASRRGRLRLIASPGGEDGSVRIAQQARIYAGRFDGAELARLAMTANRRAYVHVAQGSIDVNGMRLGPGDAATPELELAAGADAEVLVFDLP